MLLLRLPMDENHPAGGGCTNPYGKTKFFVEEIIRDMCRVDKVRAIHLFIITRKYLINTELERFDLALLQPGGRSSLGRNRRGSSG